MKRDAMAPEQICHVPQTTACEYLIVLLRLIDPVSVIDSQHMEFNPYLEKLLTPNAGINTDMDVIISNETHSIYTFNEGVHIQ